MGIGIALIVEGETEKAFLPHLRRFIETRVAANRPRLRAVPQRGRIPKGQALARLVERLLNDRQRDLQAVIALTDVYTGTPDFTDASDAKTKMATWVNDARFYPHAAQYDFEAWLLPYWDRISPLLKPSAVRPHGSPEQINHNNPPAHRLKSLFHTSGKREYNKWRDAVKILDGQDLTVAANACPELKAFLNTILALCDGELLP